MTRVRIVGSEFRRSSRAARLRYNAAERLINVGTRMTLLSRRLDSSTFFVPDPTRTRQPMHVLARLFLTLECISLRVRQSDIFCCFPRGGRFRTAAVAAAVADVRYDCTSDVTVTPNATGFPVRHGKRVSPYGRLPSVRVRPDGSIIAGISAEEKARETTSLRA